MKKTIVGLLATLLSTLGAVAVDAADERRLAYVVSYQGLFTAGVEVDIGLVELQLEAADERRQDILMLASTRNFEAAELILPVRFCYRSRQDPDGGIRQADWWSRIGGKAARGQLLVDKSQRRVLRLHSERKLEQPAGNGDYDDLLPAQAPSDTPDQDLDQAPFPNTGVPLDRLGMIQYLRGQTLEVGTVLQLPATNGRQLTGYRVTVEDRDTLTWDGRPTPTLKLRLDPVVSDDGDDHPTWLWLSADARRLPLRFRSEHPHGSFAMRLHPAGRATGVQCPVPEAADLTLPEA